MSCTVYGAWVKIDENNSWSNPNTHEKIVPSEDDKAKVKGMKIPPMWRPVWICTDNPKLAWMALGQGGKIQYGYTDAWINLRENAKLWHVYNNMDLSFWDRFHDDLHQLIQSQHGEYNYSLGLACYMLEKCHFRTGGSSSSKATGLTTLQGKHVQLRKDGVDINFTGKSSVQNTCTIMDNDVLKMLSFTDIIGDDTHIFPNLNSGQLRLHLKNKYNITVK